MKKYNYDHDKYMINVLFCHLYKNFTQPSDWIAVRLKYNRSLTLWVKERFGSPVTTAQWYSDAICPRDASTDYIQLNYMLYLPCYTTLSRNFIFKFVVFVSRALSVFKCPQCRH